MTKHAEKAGADGALVVTPYYNKPTQEGLYQHYKAINDSCGIPIIIYNIPEDLLSICPLIQWQDYLN